MEYNNIISLVPDGEHFDASAINEGVWLSQAHLDAIENSFVASAAAIENAAAEVALANDNVAAANVNIETANTTLAEREATIEALQAEVATLKAGPAAPIQQTAKDKDEQPAPPVYESEVTKEANRLRALKTKK